jgi:hypothetical protein
MGDMPIIVPCLKCGRSTTKMLSELEVSVSVICVCGGIADLTTPAWRRALLSARKVADEFDAKPN